MQRGCQSQKKCPDFYPEAPKIIVLGGGAVGKSYLIKTVAKWAEYTLRKGRDPEQQPNILLLGPTGVASKIIRGTTIHTALHFNFGWKYYPISGPTLEKVRKQCEHLHLVIIDEISVISADRLYNINRRLQEILLSQNLFGGLAVMFVGDKPIKANYIFEAPTDLNNLALYRSTDNLWKSCDVGRTVLDKMLEQNTTRKRSHDLRGL